MPITLYNEFIERPQWSGNNTTKPAFMVYCSSSINYTTTGWQHFTAFNQQRVNVGDHFSLSTKIFTAPFAGIYVFGSNVRFDNADGGYFRLIISYNDSTAVDSQAHSITNISGTGAAYHTHSVTGLYNLNAGDNVRVKLYSDGDTSWIGQYESQFWGYLVSSRN